MARVTSSGEVEPHRLRERADRLAASEQLLDRAAALVAVVACELVDVHVDEAGGRLLVDPAAEPHRVARGLAPVREARLDRLEQHGGEVVQAVAEVTASQVDAER